MANGHVYATRDSSLPFRVVFPPEGEASVELVGT
jgi:hypothetical protein